MDQADGFSGWSQSGGRSDLGDYGYQPHQGDQGPRSYQSGWRSQGREYGETYRQGGFNRSEYRPGESGSRQNHAGKGPKGWKRSDERIKEEVCEELARHPEIDAGEIEVSVAQCEVTLTGSVSDRRAKRLAEDVAEDVTGVTDVRNQLRVTHQLDRQDRSGSQAQLPSSRAGIQGTGGSESSEARSKQASSRS
jgi:hypothetical protein